MVLACPISRSVIFPFIPGSLSSHIRKWDLFVPSLSRVSIQTKASNFRPFERANQPHLWDLGSDRYLHFPATHSKQNEYLHWACNVTSDTEDESEEWLEDWLQNRASNAGLDVNFGKQEPHGESLTNNKYSDRDLFDLVNRTFEMTSFDQLLKDQSLLTKKSLQLNSLNKTNNQSNNFLRIFKSEGKKLPEQQSVEEDDEDDEHDEIDEDDLKEDQDLNSSQVISENMEEQYSRERLNLCSGLKSCRLLYGFDFDLPISDSDMAKYEKYVQLGQKNVEDVQKVDTAGSLSSFSRLPLIFQFQHFFYTIDSVFSTELDDIPEKSMKIYRDIIRKQVFEPSAQARKLYEQFN
ncbi:unnamed protein product [Bursaphelenchus xylophilus]|uniref:(pine wood nematode) hypothetical protein n=1 Tax=Bursaphelenchus xylophilus TaxID=6326 RepID=A0A7I8WR72_BURXY|nr:unnamed protein product [Bursaphelenchus xylophilus]CAG9097553.1 unnamed protein product [Bursaphelenchus xylophilus]